jgi:hypothetical protein
MTQDMRGLHGSVKKLFAGLRLRRKDRKWDW